MVIWVLIFMQYILLPLMGHWLPLPSHYYYYHPNDTNSDSYHGGSADRQTPTSTDIIKPR